MFPTSTQRKYWTFSGETEIQQLRKEANERFIKKTKHKMSIEAQQNILSPEEENLVCRSLEVAFKNLFDEKAPKYPRFVLGTAFCYFKRFYLHQSVMDYFPFDILLTCIYVSLKVEEIYVDIDSFVGLLDGDNKKLANNILTFELLVLQKLHYHLIVHNPYRSLEGLFIDLKTRSELKESAERLRKGADRFLEKAILTDACLIFAPSQIALAAIQSSASKEKINLDSYLTSVLLKGASPEELKKTVYQIKRIKYLVKSQEPVNSEHMESIRSKLNKCRNLENDPNSEVYKRKLQVMLEEDEERQTKKRQKIAEEERKTTEALLGMK